MSADDGIYILGNKSPNSNDIEYRIAYAGAIENIFNTPYGLKSCYDIFNKSPLVNSLGTAIDIAHNMDENTEYGVLVITDFQNMTFAEIEKAASDVCSKN